MIQIILLIVLAAFGVKELSGRPSRSQLNEEARIQRIKDHAERVRRYTGKND